ncbi:MAG TPA: hypothetical protein VN673_02600, partial [Clostridia bacterium]|nr:hypothetical protein [Clostridia bacterium]
MIQMPQRDENLAPAQHIVVTRNRVSPLVPGLILILLALGCITPIRADQPPSLSVPLLPSEAGSAAQEANGTDRPPPTTVDSSIRGGLKHWHRDFSSAEAYEQSIAGNRERFRAMIGAVDDLVLVKELEMVSTNAVGETDAFTAYAVRWAVFAGVHGEGLWLEPKTPAKARVVALPDADQTPEMLAGLAEGITPDQQFARRLAENGCEVLVPVLVDRRDTYFRDRPRSSQAHFSHREWIRRLASPIGRHIIGYEVQKVRAAVSYLQSRKPAESGARLPLGIAGFGEGGLIAFYAAAIDRRVDATLVSGYFDNRQSVFTEPAYRDVFGLLEAFGDAEIATLIAPRHLVIEHSPAPGKLVTADYQSVE